MTNEVIEIKPNKQLANKRLALIEDGYKPTETFCVSVEGEKGFRMLETWEKWNGENLQYVIILIAFNDSGCVIRFDWCMDP